MHSEYPVGPNIHFLSLHCLHSIPSYHQLSPQLCRHPILTDIPAFTFDPQIVTHGSTLFLLFNNFIAFLIY